jgi:hypothetical protein
MLKLKVRMAKKIIDQIGRRLLPAKGVGGAGGGRFDARGGATQGPVGEFWKGLRRPSLSSSNNTDLFGARDRHGEPSGWCVV